MRLIYRTLTDTQQKHQTNYVTFDVYMRKKGYRIEKTNKGTCLVVGKDG
jgi:hypothetical protein